MILEDLVKLLASLPPEVYSEVAHLVSGVARAPDPLQAARRAAAALAAEESAEALLKKALG